MTSIDNSKTDQDQTQSNDPLAQTKTTKKASFKSQAYPASSPMNSSPEPSKSKLPLINLLLILALAGGAGTYIWKQNQAITTLGEGLAASRQTIEKQQEFLQQQTEQVLGQAQSNNQRLVLVESKLLDFQQQQETLQAIYQSMAQENSTQLLTEVEQSLVIASQQLQLAGNLNSALSALDVAHERIVQSNRPDLAMLKAAIERDRARLVATPSLDIVNLISRLDNVLANVGQLPTLADMSAHPIPNHSGDDLTVPTNPTSTDTELPNADSGASADQSTPMDSNGADLANVNQPSFWEKTRAWADQFSTRLLADSKNLIEVRHVSNPDVLFLGQEQTIFLRNSIQLRLLTARYALVSRNKALLSEDLSQVESLLTKYFDTSSEAGKRVLDELAYLRGVDFNTSIPDINDSLRAIRFEQSRTNH